jgi:hypothetical protein
MVASLLPAALVLAAPQASAPVDAMRWEERVLLVFAPQERDAALSKQRKIVGSDGDGFRDRELRVVEVVGDSVAGARDYAPRLRQRYRIASDEFAAVLVGKDGTIKLRANRPIDTAQLFTTIDAMPMRQREIAATH